MSTDFPLLTPIINGHIWSFASIEVRVGIMPTIIDLQEINYTSTAEVGDVFGAHHAKIGTTRGQWNPTASMRMLSRSWERLRNILGPEGLGYGERRVPYIVQYGEPGSPTVTDVIDGARVVNVERGHRQGVDALSVTITLNVMKIIEGTTGMMYAPRTRGF